MNTYNRSGYRVTIPTPEKSSFTWEDEVVHSLTTHRQALELALHSLSLDPQHLAEAVQRLINTLQSGHRVLVVGNGGSAAEAQHFAAELVGRFKRERRPYAVLALTTDTSILTAIANDYGYQDIFARQVYALGQPGDMLLAFSTSGESANVISAAHAACQCGMQTIAITGNCTNQLAEIADVTIGIAGIAEIDVATAQELHMVVTHILCDLTEAWLSAEDAEKGPHYPQIEAQ
ncbi:D-sedoheptulose-7-phosphate isomerase [Dictyobacter arantiisoli]|uniref:Phosphoheptose isomerase n=1 Tax=Dictyobacter arantiisoli TaxID=2014874 RepID=A0A5A5T909_9CHLR|nr:SIS domain-containing protein [Dictyobacter arantiisoli]GCF07523.1 phosphoheptose isomerase [Dictyobacter arantiisoli]